MRWFLGLLLVVALVTGALYAVGQFLLPNDLQVTRTASIERPRAAVFAMINDLRIAKEWSPYYALDPEADYAFSGDPGAGQTMRWNSNVRQVGSGRMSIVNSNEYQEVDAILEMGGRATLNSRIELRPGETGTVVAWSVSARCAEGSVNVPCRYMNLIMRGMIERDLDSGLTRLKTLTEQLPNVDFEGLQPDFQTVAPQSYVYSQVTTSNEDGAQVEQALTIGLSQVNDFMGRFNMVQAGPQMRVTTEWDPNDNRMSFRVGYPYSGPTPLTVVGVQIGQTPSGRALRVMHIGPRSATRMTYAKIYAYLQAHRIPLRQDGLPWEIIHATGDADGSNSRVEIFVPLQ
jgi:effector-binding domain-containing protein/carbon monoxide dehydrogenase subunit G